MAEIKFKIKKVWEALTYPDDLDKEFDESCDKAFDTFFDRFINFCYFVFFSFSIISLYFFITKEII